MSGDASPTPQQDTPRRGSLLLLVGIAAVFLILRSLLVAHAQSPTYDVEPQLRVGLRFWSGELAGRAPNDPPFGQAITALPLWLMGCRADAPDVLYAQPISVETILLVTALWRAILFVPVVVVAYLWAWRLWGELSAFLAAILVLADPNLAAFIPVGTADALAAGTSLIALYLFWRYLQTPTLRRAIVAAATLGLALSIKHNAAFTAIAMLIAGAIWVVRNPDRRSRATATHALAGIAVVFLTLWALTRFDLSVPAVVRSEVGREGLRLPGGIYIGSFFRGLRHNDFGHPAYLLGQTSLTGWWYYFPVLATYKVPIGTAIALLVALISFTWRKPREEELPLLVAIAAGLAFMMYASINTGFRHFLPVYLLFLLLVARAAATKPPRWAGMAVVCAVPLVVFHALSFEPNYLAYINFPRKTPYLAISDSNVDWGQGLKQVAAWLDGHPTSRPVYLRYFGRGSAGIQHYLGDRVHPLSASDPVPQSGLLIISPVFVAGAYDDHYAFLRPHPPIATIGNSMQVYELDALQQQPQLGQSGGAAIMELRGRQ